MSVKRIEFPEFNISIGINNLVSKPSVRKEFVENPQLNIYHPVKGNPVIENLMEKVVLKRSIPLLDGIETLEAIKEKVPYLTKYIDFCIEELNSYKNMI